MRHPEQRGDEAFLTNGTAEEFHHKIGWRTRRVGRVAYDSNNQPINSYTLFPIFVKKSEVVEHQLGMNDDGIVVAPKQ